MPRKSTVKSTQDELLAEFQALVSDTEKLLQSSAELVGEEAENLRDQLRAGLNQVRERIGTVQDSVQEHGKAAVDATEDYVGEHPWQAVGIAAGIGFLLGLLVGRR